jgi:hypothetical protein
VAGESGQVWHFDASKVGLVSNEAGGVSDADYAPNLNKESVSKSLPAGAINKAKLHLG